MFGFLLAIPDPTCPPSPFPELKIARSVLVSLEPVLLHVDHGNFILLPFFLCRGENAIKSKLIFVWSCALEYNAALRSLRALALPVGWSNATAALRLQQSEKTIYSGKAEPRKRGGGGRQALRQAICADLFCEVELVNVLLRDFIADVAPAPDQELSQGHAPAFGIYEYFIVVPATGLSAESTPDE